MDPQATAQLCMEAMGTIRIQTVAKAGDRCPIGLEYGQIGPWSLATEQESCAELWNAHILFCGFGLAAPEGGQAVTQSTEPPWYVIRMPGGVGGEES